MSEDCVSLCGLASTIQFGCGNLIFQSVVVCEVNNKVTLQGGLISSKMGEIILCFVITK